jgi:methionyl aminopeptidase
MTLAIEPMAIIGKNKLKTLLDKWTVVTTSGNLTCHHENTIVITSNGYEILTKL